MNQLLIIVVDGLVFASWLFLVSVGLSLIYGVLRILNIAHGSLFAVGAYAGASLVVAYSTAGLWPPGALGVLLAAALAAGLVAGPVIERGIIRWTYGREPVMQLLVTFSVFLILEDLTKLVWGVSPYYAYQPYQLLGQVRIGGIDYPAYSFLLLLVAALTGVGLWWFVRRTRFGRVVVAVIHDPEISVAMGVNLSRVYVTTFALGSVLAALGGAFTAPMISVVPGIGVEVIVLAFAVVVVGGLGSLEGAAAGALLIGLVRAAAVHLLPVLELFTIYLVMAAVLLVRPLGLFGRVEARRI
ncbi:MAG: branched-chain amino acid ABC transporter permease [Armatimonadota bacterium]|nr:branched-chain amino acid ABC transporter permease [Armatimonadota bacterium]MDR7513318.1 branched-chain amino acid ABC transporter permease [Armatimonadota bacterium]MDR7565728.1 branched-chain amino acid ABC transporter permease [Armatimonadota bacterium]MDR7578341.1 branched-chain amino acid ABC transporter permease [Armatimonadota bacterium]MDR7580082.1 branched-chain amino acid ABC transporter permease [Armatimonadota bacterium]